MSVISIIVPVYKVEPYLHRCVDSILCQNFSDFELILVDDGSPDGCPDICDNYATKDARVRVIHQANAGVSAARNTGIDWVFSNSNSQWLCFVDGDDWIHPEYLSQLLNAAVSHNSDISVCGYAKTSGEEPWVDFIPQEPTLWDVEKLYLTHRTNITVSWAKLFHRRCFSSIRFPKGRIYEDEFTLYKIWFSYHMIPYVSAPLYAYFQNNNSITHVKRTEKNYIDAAEAFEEQALFFKKKQFSALCNISARQALYKYKEAVTTANPRRKPVLKRLLREKIRFFRKDLGIQLSGNEPVYEKAMPIRSALSKKWRHTKKFIRKVLR